MSVGKLQVPGGGHCFGRTLLFGIALSAANLLRPAPLPAQTAVSAEAGKQIFTKGESPSQSQLEAVLGDTAVPATLMPCASCHGADGKGRPEGGVTPSDITWDSLSKPYVTDEALARRRPAYDLNSLRKVLREGVDSGGNELGITMPRFHISDNDLSSLIAYLQQLGIKTDPGVGADSIRAATVVPANGPLAPLGSAIASLLRSYFDDQNAKGGIYGRKIELEVITTGGTQGGSAAQVSEAVRRQNIFAVVGVLAPGEERSIAESLEKAGVPAIDTFAEGGSGELPARSKVFHLLSGLTEQARVLVKFAQSRLSAPAASFAVVYPKQREAIADAVTEECRVRACKAVVRAGYSNFDAGKVLASLGPQRPSALIFLGSGAELAALLDEAARQAWTPMVFQPGPLAGQDVFRLPQEYSERLFLSFPTLPSDMEQDALREYGALLRKYKLEMVQPARALAALAAAKVFVEGLRQEGRELSREGYVDTLSSMYNFGTGLTPPISYGATRRIGALGAYVVKLDPKAKSFTPVDSWIEQ